MAAAAASKAKATGSGGSTEPPQLREQQQQQLLQVPQQAPGGKEVVVLEHNFDRLSVLSVSAEISVDDEVEGDASDEEEGAEDEEGEGEEARTARLRLRARPGIGLERGGRNAPLGYKEAEGDARLAWRWVEGWRARLRKGADVVEKARGRRQGRRARGYARGRVLV